MVVQSGEDSKGRFITAPCAASCGNTTGARESLPRQLTHVAGKLVLAVSWELSQGLDSPSHSSTRLLGLPSAWRLKPQREGMGGSSPFKGKTPKWYSVTSTFFC